ncbi:MAG: hypothetical protein AAF800_07260 [Planctomycetota bacterium]
MDTLIGLSLVAALAATLAATHTQHRKTGRAMADQRQAVRTLESQAERLAVGQPLDTPEITRHADGSGWARLVHRDERGRATELFVYLGPTAADDEGGQQP